MHPTTHRAFVCAALCACALTGILTTSTDAHAFCGTYVTGSSEGLTNDATQVALMRDGTTTVLSMENNYKGPPQDFAMVVPVPQILMQDDVKTLDPEIFRDLDRLTAPRLVEYWEKDPCEDNVRRLTRYTGGCEYYEHINNVAESGDMSSWAGADMGGAPPPPTVEAEFAVGEYDILILSAEEATGLETWLRQNNYNIPQGATDLFDQYIQQGMYFFVAKVNTDKVTFAPDGTATLSPLRFHYTSLSFSLPIRLGMLNSSGTQDLIVYIMADGDRYEVANYPNAVIPTNMNVVDEVREDFAAFYEKIFSRVQSENPGAVVTEYAWDSAGKCDPCPPSGPLEPEQFATLGGDVLSPERPGMGNVNFNLTRLHARYGKSAIDEDLRFQIAPHIVGGTGTSGPDQGQTRIDGKDQGVFRNQFQGRYIIHNQFEGPYECDHVVRGRWLGSPQGGSSAPVTAPGPNTAGGIADDSVISKSIAQLRDDTVPATGSPKVIEEVIDRGPCNDPDAENYGSGGGSDNDDVVQYGPTGSNNGEGGDGPTCSMAMAPASGGMTVLVLLGMVGFWRRRRD